MKVLWVTNLIFPDVASQMGIGTIASGGWLTHFLKLLSVEPGIECRVISGYAQDQYKSLEINDIKYYMVPIKNIETRSKHKKRLEILQQIVDEYKPDLIHIHGMEFALGLDMYQLNTTAKIVVNVQTIAKRIYDNRNGGIPLYRMLINIAPLEVLKGKGLLMRKYFSYRRKRREEKYLKQAKYIIGNTTYDEAYVKENSRARYYFCPYLYRESFYTSRRWTPIDVERNTIFTGQAVSPIKGLHVLIESLKYIKNDIPDIKLYIPGPNLSTETMTRNYSYARYIMHLISKYGLTENVVFTGVLNEEQMVERMRLSNVVVVPSAIELGSSTVIEAMLIGTPVIASFRGGMTENLLHGQSGYFYDYDEVFMLKYYVLDLIKNTDRAKMFSNNARNVAREEHDPQKCLNKFIETYEKILSEE